LPGMAADFVERGAVLIGALFWLPKQRWAFFAPYTRTRARARDHEGPSKGVAGLRSPDRGRAA
jgi:hypothetical protein